MSSNQASQHSRPKLRFVLGAVTVASAASWCAAAHAQSSVTLYGIADVGIEHINNTNTGGAQTREASGNLSGSRWGLKGVEDLGGGMKAIFQLENGFNINDGTTAQSTKGLGSNAATTSRIFGRQAWVGLAYRGQQLTFGRQNALFTNRPWPSTRWARRRDTRCCRSTTRRPRASTTR